MSPSTTSVIYTQRDDLLQPVLDIVQLRARNRVDMQRWLGEVLEDEHNIKLLQTELDTFE